MTHECKKEDAILKLTKFQGRTESDIDTIKLDLHEIKENHLKHLNDKLTGLLFTVLGSVFIAVIIWAFTHINK